MQSSGGVTNYATDKPAYAYTDATTEFDDACIKRGIMTPVEAIMRKGASIDEALRLVELHEQQKVKEPTTKEWVKCNADDDDDSFLDDDDHQVLDRYRHERMAQMEKEVRLQSATGRQRFGDAIFIDRMQWNSEVNDASQFVWVVVCLTSSDTNRTGRVENSVRSLSAELDTVKFVFIPAHQAFERSWPAQYLPTLFFYRRGIMQKQLLSLPPELTVDELREMLEPIIQDSFE